MGALLLSGCSFLPPKAPPAASSSPPSRDAGVAAEVSTPPGVSGPDDALGVRELTPSSPADPDSDAVAASRAYFSRASVVVVGPDPDEGTATGDADVLLASSAAVALGVPLLVPGGGLDAELDRLGATAILQVGTSSRALGAAAADRSVVRADSASEVAAALADALGAAPDVRRVALDADGVAAIAALPRAGSVILDAEPAADGSTASAAPRPDASAADGATDHGSGGLPRVTPAVALDGEVALVASGRDAVPAAATAQAAGARVVPLAASDPDPQDSSDAITALSADGVTSVTAIGGGFETSQLLAWQVASARSGLQLPGGGQRILHGRTLVAMYGTPGAPVLGVLGEQGLDASIARAEQFASPYRSLLPDRTIIPAFEIIATVASGTDGSNEISPSSLEPWVKAAGEQGMYVVLDLQPGRADFLTQAKAYESLLAFPWVGLALDPEWRLAPGEKHIVNIGEVDSSEINGVESWLGDLVQSRALPPKLLVLHQFRTDMIIGRGAVRVDDPRVQVLIHADGQGSQPAKQATWRALHAGAPDVPWGWKNFIDEDRPMLTPEQTIQQVTPTPALISYQ